MYCLEFTEKLCRLQELPGSFDQTIAYTASNENDIDNGLFKNSKRPTTFIEKGDYILHSIDNTILY